MADGLYPWFDNEWVAGLPAVNREVLDAAKKFKAKWVAGLAGHTRTGLYKHSIRIYKANDKDYWITASVNYAAASEFGHQGFVTDKFGNQHYIGPVRGIHVLRSLL